MRNKKNKNHIMNRLSKLFLSIACSMAFLPCYAVNRENRAITVLNEQDGFCTIKPIDGMRVNPATMPNLTQKENAMLQELTDRMALKNLVDTFSNLADMKDVEAQVLLFTDSAEVVSYHGIQETSRLKGRKVLAERFGAFLDRFDVVYHINGQQVVKLDGDKATGIAYCQVVLIDMENGRKIMTTQGVRYEDEYVRQEGKWLISKRTSHFEWSDIKESEQQ